MAKFAFDAVAGEPADEVNREYRFSLFRSLGDPAPQTITLAELRDLVSDGEYSDLICRVRGAVDKDSQTALKRGLPCVTVSGVFSGGHKENHLLEHSGLLCVDFDADKNPCLDGCAEEWRDKLAVDEFVRMAFVSAGGNGVAAICRVEGDRHSEAFDALQAYFKSRHGLVIDRSCRDVTRLRFLSWDQEIAENEHARTFRRYSLATEPKPERKADLPDAPALTMRKERREEILSALERVCPDERQAWLDIGMAIQSEAPNLEGFNLWRVWSEFNDVSGKYREKDLERVWQSFGRRAGVNIETLFALAYKAGWKGPQPTPHLGGSLPVIGADVWLASKVPPRDPIIEGVLDAGTFAELIAPSKCRKSFFAMQMATCIASGMKFLAWPVPRPRKVLLINVELLADRAHDRESAMTTSLGTPREDLSRLLVSNIRGLDLADPLGAICCTIREHRPEVTIVDPLYLIHGEDENDQRAMTTVFKRLAAVQAETRSAMLIVHHDAKGKAGDRDKRDRGSGSGVMGRFSDSRIILTPHKDDPDNLICVETLYRYTPPQLGITARMEAGRFVVADETCEPETSKPKRKLKSDAVLDAAIEAIAKDIVSAGPYSAGVIRQKMKDMGVTNNSKQTEGVRKLKAMAAACDAQFSFVEMGGGRVTFGTPDALIEYSKPKAYTDDF